MQEQKVSNPALAHLRANLWLLVLSVVICCVVYPFAVWGLGQALFRHAAEGSLIDKNGSRVTDPKDAVGSRQIAQQFNSAWFFQPRPSAASYNGAASGASNYSASNPKLRGRVAQLLGTIARYSEAYKKAHPKPDGTEPSVQDDILTWFKEQTTAQRDVFAEQKLVLKPDASDSDVEAAFFDAWFTEQVRAKKLDPARDFEQVPADMVMTSGSGLDPDITLDNARYQQETVVAAYADKIASDYVAKDANKNLTDDQKKKLHDDVVEKVKPQIGRIAETVLDALQYRPMFGLTGDKQLVNVLQLNLRLQAEAANVKVP